MHQALLASEQRMCAHVLPLSIMRLSRALQILCQAITIFSLTPVPHMKMKSSPMLNGDEIWMTSIRIYYI